VVAKIGQKYFFASFCEILAVADLAEIKNPRNTSTSPETATAPDTIKVKTAFGPITIHPAQGNLL